MRPFISYKRASDEDVSKLRDKLCLFGAGAWKDTDDLLLGTRTDDELRQVILNRAGGFLWWGTRAALDSPTITQIEIPAALERADNERFPVVPVFVDIDPTNDEALIRQKVDRASDLCGLNGLVRKPKERTSEFCARAARRYVRDSILAQQDTVIRVAFRAHGAADESAHLTCDWRQIFDVESRTFARGTERFAKAALENIRDSLQHRQTAPEVHVDTDLPLPLAMMVGYLWREPTRLRVTVLQRTEATYGLIATFGARSEPPEAIIKRLGGDGPGVVAVSCGETLQDVALRYASDVSACELHTVHMDGVLDARGIRTLAFGAVAALRQLRDRGHQKHLLMRGPGALAVTLGVLSNALGPTIVPFWHNATETYVNPVSIGASG